MTYTIAREHGCILIHGAVPINEFVALTKAWDREDENWVFSSLLPEAVGATFVLGPQTAIEAWCIELGLPWPATLRTV